MQESEQHKQEAEQLEDTATDKSGTPKDKPTLEAVSKSPKVIERRSTSASGERTDDRDSARRLETGESETSAEPAKTKEPEAAAETGQESAPESESPEDDVLDPNNPDITAASVLEAVLFAADEPVTGHKLSEIAGNIGLKNVKDHIEQLNEKYQKMECAFRIETIAGGFLMLTLPQFKPWLSKLIKVRGESKLSPAALETLAIIAYKQPIMRVDIESIRGVGAGEMVRQLIEKGLVKIVGRAEELGRPLLYGTTKKFLEVFGLNSLKDLPTTDDLKNPDKKGSR